TFAYKHQAARRNRRQSAEQFLETTAAVLQTLLRWPSPKFPGPIPFGVATARNASKLLVLSIQRSHACRNVLSEQSVQSRSPENYQQCAAPPRVSCATQNR